jgi:hypothetical protein
MSLGGVRSRVPWGLVVCAVLVPTASCTAVAGIGSFAVDPCFDGCDGGGNVPDAPGSETTVRPDGAAEAAADSSVDAGPCDCPTGTEPINGACVVTASSPPSVNCTTPLQLPDCAMKAVVKVCDTDPPFTISESTCIGDGGATRPTGFIRLGNAPAGTWKVTINAAYSASRPMPSCASGTAPCRADGTASSNFTTASLPNGDVLALGKRGEVSGCQDITVTVTPN